MKNDENLKVVVFCDLFLNRYTKDEFKENPACTLGAELSRVEKNIDDDHVIVDLWDTAG